VFDVEPICRVLTEHGTKIARSTSYEARSRPMSPLVVREARLREHIRRVHHAYFGVYGARKAWLQLRRRGIDVAHGTVERLMRELGLSGAHRGKRKCTTIPDPQAARATDLVKKRQFDPPAPNTLWGADFIYVSTSLGWVYVAFVTDAYSRRTVGWRCSTSMTTPLILDASEHAIWSRAHEGITDLGGLIHHNPRRSQYTSVTFTRPLLDAGIDASIGATGSSYDNPPAETINGLHKNRTHQTPRALPKLRPGRDRDHGMRRL
jgi:putative transposase